MITNNEKITVAFGNSATKTLSYVYNPDMDLSLSMSISTNDNNRKQSFTFDDNTTTKTVSVVSSTVGLTNTDGEYITCDAGEVLEIIL